MCWVKEMADVSFTNLLTNSWDNLYALLQTGTYALTTNNIYGFWNDKLAKNVTLPIVVIRKPLVSVTRRTIASGVRQAELSFLIGVYHTTDANCKAVMDEVMSALTNQDALNVFAGNQMYVDDKEYITPGDTRIFSTNKKKIHVTEVNVNFVFGD